MEGITLLERARTAGLRVHADGETLIIRGPRQAEHVALELLQHKAEVLRQLRGWSTPEPEAQNLLAWASELAEQALELSTPVEYVEAPARHVTTDRVSWYASRYLRTVVEARHHQQNPSLCSGQWTPEWWQERQQEAMGALAALRTAVIKAQGNGLDHGQQPSGPVPG